MISWNRYYWLFFLFDLYLRQEKILVTHWKESFSRTQIWNAIAISFVVGLYDGFIGPGTGSFWLYIMGFDFT
jgi:uncharacterized membrane protein YfcA